MCKFKIYLVSSDYDILSKMKNFKKYLSKIINGCKPSYIPKKINLHSKFRYCCNRHDFNYWIADLSRKECDKQFLNCMKLRKTSKIDYFQIYIFYILVRLFGKSQYSKKRKTIKDFLNL